jgi:hypothetical protein
VFLIGQNQLNQADRQYHNQNTHPSATGEFTEFIRPQTTIKGKLWECQRSLTRGNSPIPEEYRRLVFPYCSRQRMPVGRQSIRLRSPCVRKLAWFFAVGQPITSSLFLLAILGFPDPILRFSQVVLDLFCHRSADYIGIPDQHDSIRFQQDL